MSLFLLPLHAALATAAATPPPAAPAAPAAAPAKPWTFQWRYRHESVDDEAFARDAEADTLRLRIGFSHGFGKGWSTYVEGEGVAELSSNFNSSANGHTGYPTVPDVRALEINQAWLDWRGSAFGTRIGRQMVNLDNARFLGNVAWRQNMQTFDAAQFQWKPNARYDLQAYWLNRVHRVNGDEARDPLLRERALDGRLLHLQRNFSNGSLVGYGYWIEDRDVASASSRTAGLRWTAAWPINSAWKFGSSLEYARQSPWADASGGSSSYVLVEPRIEKGPLSFRLGYERLGAGDGRAFQTPLATLHAFNGWADKFLTTPINGLEDRYASVQNGFTLAGKAATWQLAFHDFQSDRGSVDYGSEWDASLGVTLRTGLVALAKLGDYRSDGFARDTRKLWFQLEWNY